MTTLKRIHQGGEQRLYSSMLFIDSFCESEIKNSSTFSSSTPLNRLISKFFRNSVLYLCVVAIFGYLCSLHQTLFALVKICSLSLSDNLRYVELHISMFSRIRRRTVEIGGNNVQIGQFTFLAEPKMIAVETTFLQLKFNYESTQTFSDEIFLTVLWDWKFFVHLTKCKLEINLQYQYETLLLGMMLKWMLKWKWTPFRP